MAPSALAFGVMAPASAWAIRRFGAQLTLLVGALVMAVAYVVRIPLSHELGHVVVGTLVVAAGTSMTFSAMPTLIMAAVPASETAAANGLNTLLRSVGTSTASAALAALTTGLVITAGGTQYPSYAAFTVVFWLAAGASAVAGLITLPLLRPASV
jgi:cyanate permease